MTFRRVAVVDNIGSNLGPHLIPCISFIEQSRHHGSILVHCRQGVSRSSTICVAYLMKMRGMRFPEALAYVKAQRSAARPNAAFVSQLEDYDAQLEEAREKVAARRDGQRGGGAGLAHSHNFLHRVGVGSMGLHRVGGEEKKGSEDASPLGGRPTNRRTDEPPPPLILGLPR